MTDTDDLLQARFNNNISVVEEVRTHVSNKFDAHEKAYETIKEQITEGLQATNGVNTIRKDVEEHKIKVSRLGFVFV